MSLSRLPSQRMWAGRSYGFSMVSSWSAWASGVSVGLPHIESTGSFNARHGAGQVAGRYGGSTPAHSAVAASAGACRPLANGLANGRNCCHLVGLPAYALEGRLGPGTRNRPDSNRSANGISQSCPLAARLAVGNLPVCRRRRTVA